MTQIFDLNFPCANGQPKITAKFRHLCEDFVVNEVLGFKPDGEGEHVFLEILKRDDNTPWIAKQIAKLAGVKIMDVGYCGLKDRRAVTRQWFSVYLPSQALENWTELNSDTCQLLNQTRHPRKLRRGGHQANQFIIRLRDVEGDSSDIEARLNSIARDGVPNYFGEQRFGRDASNLTAVEQLLAANQNLSGRRPKAGQRRGARSDQSPGPKAIIMSAARSWLFNQVLAERVRQNTWRDCVSGEPVAEASGPLWGRGRNASSGDLSALESRVLEPWAAWCDGLEHAGLAQERRALVLKPASFTWRFEDRDLVLSFALQPGQYATAILREICQLLVLQNH